MFLKISFLNLLFTLSLFSFGQIEIRGVFPGAEKHEINVHAPADLVSYRQIPLGSCFVDDTSGFVLNLPLKHWAPVYLEVGYYSYQFYAIPGKKYFLISDTLRLTDVYRPFYNKEPLPCWVTETPGVNVNHVLGSINADFNDFILANFGGIYQNRRAGLFNSFKVEMNEKLDSLNNPFIQAYSDYKIASAEWSVIPQKKAYFFKTYLEDKPILYNNTEYMGFVGAFFLDIPRLNNRFIDRTDLVSGINYEPHYSALLDSLGKDTLLRNEKLRELVMLFTLMELHGNPSFSKARINRFFEQIKLESKFEQHREIAWNLNFELNDLQKGTPAKDFQLLSLLGDTTNLWQFEGNPVYLGFFTTWSYACLAEFDGMQKLFETYGDRIHFITIILDENKEVAIRLKKEKNYSWDFLFNGTHYKLLNDYRVKTFPSFILLDDELNIVQYPAYKPSEVIEGEFRRLIAKPKE